MSMFSNTHIFNMSTTVTFVDTAEEIVEVGHLISGRFRYQHSAMREYQWVIQSPGLTTLE